MNLQVTELLFGRWELNSEPQKEQLVFLITEPVSPILLLFVYAVVCF